MLTLQEKNDLLPFCKQIYELAKAVRKTEISILERDLKYNDPFMQLAVKLIFEGVKSEYIRTILNNCITIAEASEKDRVKKIIITEGVLMIQAGAPDDLIYLLMLSYLGLEHCNDFILGEEHCKLSCDGYTSSEEANQPIRMTQDILDSKLNKETTGNMSSTNFEKMENKK